MLDLMLLHSFAAFEEMGCWRRQSMIAAVTVPERAFVTLQPHVSLLGATADRDQRTTRPCSGREERRGGFGQKLDSTSHAALMPSTQSRGQHRGGEET